MIRIGVDFGGTKIEAAALDAGGRFLARVRSPTPGDYADQIAAVCALVAEAEREAGAKAARIGVGGPGSVSGRTGLMRNSNSTTLNGKPFPQDLAKALGREVRYANDANCLALSEATDGAGQDGDVVFAAILGTGCGAGITVGRRIIAGRNGVAGEWGHMPLPSPTSDEATQPCWCGRRACMELFVSGTGFGRDAGATAEEAVTRMRAGDAGARAAFARYVDRLARGLATVVDVLDPDVIVLGGGMSNVDELYGLLPDAIAPRVFSDAFETPIRRAVHGDSSGVRGAAWLWPL